MSAPSLRKESYRWCVVAMLWVVCVFNYADRQAIFSVFPLLKSELGLTDIQLGVVSSSFMWVYAIAGPMAGWISDRLSRKRVILGALMFWSAVTAGTALSHNYWELVLFRALGGLGEAFYFPAAMSLISDYHGKDTRSRAMSLHQSGVYAGSIAGGALSGYLAQHWGWRWSFTLFGMSGALWGIMLLAFLREPLRQSCASPHGPWEIRQGLKQIFSHSMVATLIGIFIGANFVAMIFLTWLPSFLYRKFSMSLSLASFNATVYLQIASVLGVITGGWLADKWARRYRGGRMLTQALGLACGVPFLFLTGWTVSVPVLVLAMAGFGYFKGMYDANIFASLYDVVAVERRAAAAGILNSLGWLGGGIAPIAIAAASSHYGMSACISATAAIYLALACLLAAAVKSDNLSL
jgi:MFS family permease